jgi:cyclopropane-fatty-acyl-phospholipid synthase
MTVVEIHSVSHRRVLRRAAARVALGTVGLSIPSSINEFLARHRYFLSVYTDGKIYEIGELDRGSKRIEFDLESKSLLDDLLSHFNLYKFAKMYFDGRLTPVSDISEFIDFIYDVNLSFDQAQTYREKAKILLFCALKKWVPKIGERFESDFHYALSANAYSMFLDKNMQYTCGYFLKNNDSLDQSQINKFELIKIYVEKNICNNKHVSHLDIGCGWGGLARFMSEKFGFVTTAISNNKVQVDYARSINGVNAKFGDFTLMKEVDQMYDLITIVGMAEHLTASRRDQLFRMAKEKLYSQGIIYFQCIAKPKAWIGGDAYRIAFETIFPGHFLEDNSTMERRFDKMGLDVLFAEDHGRHYEKTLSCWASNLSERKNEIISIIGQKNYRMLYGYIIYGQKLFENGRGSLMRYILVKR